MKSALILSVLTTSLMAFAGPKCVSKDTKKDWKNQDEFKKELEKDYKIKVFKVTKGNCYEIYGWNKAGQKVEIYFNPITGAKVKEEIN